MSESETITVTVSVPLQAGERKCAHVTQTQTVFDSTWTLPMSLTDGGGSGLRCQYEDPCSDHYYHYGSLDDMSPDDTWYTISGKSKATVVSESTVKTFDGPCPKDPKCPHCAGKVDTYEADWGSSAQDRCSQWINDSDWGALGHGKTVAQSCADDSWGSHCAATCCFALGGKIDKMEDEWGSSPQDRCSKWSQDDEWGALSHGKTLSQSCTDWGDEFCAATCCAAGA